MKTRRLLTSFIAAMMGGMVLSSALMAAPTPLTGESSSARVARSEGVPPNSVVEMLQRLLQDHQRLQELRAERSQLESEVNQTQNETDDWNARLQSMRETAPAGEPNPRREQAQRRLASAESRLNASNQKLSRTADEIDEITSNRNAIAMALLRRLVLFVVFAFIIWLLARLLRRIPERIVKQEENRFYINKLITYTGRLIVILIFLYTIFGDLGSFSAFLGLTGAGIAIALQDVIVSFIAWFFIIGRHGLSIGDRVEVQNVRGDIVDIGVLRVVIQEVGNWLSNDLPTGRRVYIPNSFVFKNYFFNYTKPQPFINDEIKLLITFESDWEKAVETIRSAGRTVLQEFFGGEGHGKELVPQNESLTHWGVGVAAELPEVFTRIAESGVEIRVVYFTRVRERNKVRDAMNRAILRTFSGRSDFSLAYPTSRAIPTPPGVKP